MFTRHSPLKRKHNEFRDPDYPQQQHQENDSDDVAGCSTSFANKMRKSGDMIDRNVRYLDKVKNIIETEFQREIVIKQQELKEIDDRLENAKNLLERLRYGIVSEYYKKQEIPLTSADAATLRSPNCLFEKEDKGPQLPLHPSVKKLIGKRPKDLSEFMRTCPKRTAAQNAVQTIRAKSQAQKREERKLKKIIRDQGIVIDHSKQSATENDVNTLLSTAVQNSIKDVNDSTPSKVKFNQSCGKSLNAARLNNKTKHQIAVGNTSKYIGNEVDWDTKTHAQKLTHKWLVYVQSKETNYPIERFIKKVRFSLHHSYRPNDVVDIDSPPFQVSRRGWGEFPIRVQLFFHQELHQKPVQLIHNIILDQTLSGIQTLGAETLLEIWLRDIKSTNSVNIELNDTKTKSEVGGKEISTKPKTEIMTHSDELVDDNLLDFLNKIESSPCSISADIEKIQPTVLVNDDHGLKMKTPSPEKCKLIPLNQQKSPIKRISFEKMLNIPKTNLTSNAIDSKEQRSISVSTSATPLITTTPLFTSSCIATKPVTTFVKLPTSSTQVQFFNNKSTVVSNISRMPPLTPITSVTKCYPSPTTQKPTIILNKDAKILMPAASVASAVHKTILPIVNSLPATISSSTLTSQTSQISISNKPQVVTVPSSSTSVVVNPPQQILQKKLVQLVDSTGKVKYIQMLVAASSSSSSVQNFNTSSAVAPKLITMSPSCVKNNSVTNTTQITKAIMTPLLRAPNGTHLVPAMTTKPNIFKIVPDNRQTKPQIIRFGSTTTVGTSHLNMVPTVSSQPQLQHTTTAQITPPSNSTIVKPFNEILPVANKLQKSSNQNVTPTKNLVFQKEGTLYIIDPEQMKYKQQQKNQVSLLKPEISLLKQQQQKIVTPPSSRIDAIKTNSSWQVSNNTNIPQVHFGLKQQRINSINALQLMQMKRMMFEKQFLRQEFTNVRSAVEYLLRRLKLVVEKDSLIADFPFMSYSLQEFYSLTAFKQRSYEWLRAKNVSRLVRNHKDLQRLNSTSKELFWSTKEIATFARQYAYTPPIKSLPRPDDQQQSKDNSSKEFVDLVKSELKQEHNLYYDTLTDHCKVRKWVDEVWQTLDNYEQQEDQHKIIDVTGIEDNVINKTKKTQATYNANSPHLKTTSFETYLPPPAHLENECELVSDICKDLNIKLAHEELEKKIYHPTTQTILAQSLHLFIEKLLRQCIALKQGNSASASSCMTDSMFTLMPQDFVKVLASNSEFDFLTNNNFGSASLADCLENSIKQENS